MKRVAIIGGGLAGLAAAVRLAEHDCEVVLIETRKKLGGRATSFVDPRSNEVLDNCQHVLMGCCTNLIDLYDRLGVLDAIEWHKKLYWTRGNGRIDTMKAGLLPAPLHFTGSFQRMHVFSKQDKRAIARGMWRMIRMGASGRYQWRERTFAEFLRECHQPESAVRDFWNTIIVSACNLPVDRVSAASAIQVFQDGFLANKWSYTMGLANVPLWELYDPAAAFIEERGGQIRLGESAKAIAYDGTRVTGVITEHEVVNAGSIISAVPFDRLDKLVSSSMKAADERLSNLDKLDVSPILGVHLFFEQQVMPPELPHLVLTGPDFRGVQWLFNKTAGCRYSVCGSRSELNDDNTKTDKPTTDNREPTPENHIHAVISAADDWMGLDEQTIIDRVLEDVHRALPESKGITPIRARSVKEKRATFSVTPGTDDFRPSVTPTTLHRVGMTPSHRLIGSSGIPNLFLAGDWVDTGWPATMEGAVRSGYAAAAAILADETQDVSVIEDVPPGRLAAMLGLR